MAGEITVVVLSKPEFYLGLAACAAIKSVYHSNGIFVCAATAVKAEGDDFTVTVRK